MKKILAIGGAVIKTAKEELRKVIESGDVEMLIHNGGSIFHDFQQVIDENLEGHSYPIDKLTESFECNRLTSNFVWNWIKMGTAPRNSITDLCHQKGISVLLFTGLGCDFWHLHGNISNWQELAKLSFMDLRTLIRRFQNPFHYICMGSAVIHPEVFIKAVAEAHPFDFIADVVDFKDMYRPRTRVAKYGTYYKMTHKEYLNKWMKEK